MRLAATIVVALAATASAQPGVAPLEISSDEQRLLDRGVITEGERIGGSVTALVVGFGAGHALQGRWGEKGWIFTVGEPLALAATVFGIYKYDDLNQGRWVQGYYEDDGRRLHGRGYAILGVGGLLTFGVLRLWQWVDAYMAPQEHNRKVRALRARVGIQMTPYLAPTRDRDGGVAGVSFRF